MRTRTALVLGCVVFAAATVSVPAAPAPQSLDPAALDEALRIARTRRPAEYDRFNAPYIVVRGGPGQPTVEVITEFRRAVLLARHQVDLGNHTWSPTNLARALEKHAGLTTVQAQVWLPPNHLYVGTPTYRLDLYDVRNRAVPAVSEKREPIYSTLTGEGSALTGVTLETLYRDPVLRDPGCCLVVIVDPRGEPVVRQQLAMSSVR